MDNEGLGVSKWVARVVEAGFTPQCLETFFDRKGRFQGAERDRFEVQLAKPIPASLDFQNQGLEYGEREAEKAWTAKVLAWAEGENQRLDELLGMLPATGAIQRASTASWTGVSSKINGVEQTYWEALSPYCEHLAKLTNERAKLNSLFDEKMDQEIEDDPDIMVLMAQQLELEELLNRAREKKRVEKEAERDRFLYVADNEWFDRGGL